MGGPRLLLIALTALALVVGATACDNDSAGPEEGVTAEDVAEGEDAEQLVGRQVTISGEVVEVISGNALRLGLVAGDEEGLAEFDFGVEDQDVGVLVILGSQAQDTEVAIGVLLEVTGTVMRFDIPAIEQQAGVDLDDEALASQVEEDGVEDEEDAELVIVASSVSPAPEEE